MRSEARPRTAGFLSFLLLATLPIANARPASAQLNELVGACIGPTLAVYPNATARPCAEAALLGQAAQGGVGLALAGPGTLVGSASTLGRRFGSTPRVVVSVRGGLTRFPIPDLNADPVGNRTSTVPSLHGSVVAGVFDGFSPKPTVGGVLAVDLVLTGDWAFPSGDDGFDGSVGAWGYGLRIGVLRESFTLPGITLSATRRHQGSVEIRPAPDGFPRVGLEGTTSSFRGEVGKDLAGFGLLGGVGWDRYSSDVSFRLGPLEPSGPEVSLSTSGFDSDRVLFFGGISRTFLVAQIAGEFGYAQGFGDGRPEVPGYDADEGTLFGTLSFRLTF
jgi:hypothetical protein